MLNSEKTTLKKGRWLVLEQTNHTKEDVLALIRAIDGAEIQVIDTKTYVRFPERQAKSVRFLYRVTKNLRQKNVTAFVEDAEPERPRQYCAVILKNWK